MLSAARLACEPLAESPWTLNTQVVTTHVKSYKFRVGLTFFGELKKNHLGMDQYLLIPFLVG